MIITFKVNEAVDSVFKFCGIDKNFTMHSIRTSAGNTSAGALLKADVFNVGAALAPAAGSMGHSLPTHLRYYMAQREELAVVAYEWLREVENEGISEATVELLKEQAYQLLTKEQRGKFKGGIIFCT